MDTKTARIRALNDELRQNFAEGMAVMTPGIAALGAEVVARIVKTIVAVFDDFCLANDPHQEHLRLAPQWRNSSMTVIFSVYSAPSGGWKGKSRLDVYLRPPWRK